MQVEKCYEFRDLVTFVPNKKIPIYNWYYYKEGFSRDFVIHYLNKWKPSSVLDPFCGVGTTLLASKEFGIRSTGIDINPVALLASRVKTSEYDERSLMKDFNFIFSQKFTKTDYPSWLRRFFPKHSLEDIFFFRKLIDDIENRDFFLLALITSAYRSSWIYKDGAVLKVKKKPVPPFRKFFRRTVRRMIKESQLIHGPIPEIKRDDARYFDLGRKFSAVITSPPYVNKIEYAKIYKVENEILGEGFETPSLRSFISYEPDNYFKDMRMVVERIVEHLDNGGHVALVVAGAVLPDGRNIESDIEIARIMDENGLRIERICEARRRVVTRNRTIKIGESRESVIEAVME